MAMEPATTKVTVPVTATPPGPVRVKVAGVMVAGSIASLKVAAIAWLTGTAVALFAGFVEITVGGMMGPGPVLKPHT